MSKYQIDIYFPCAGQFLWACLFVMSMTGRKLIEATYVEETLILEIDGELSQEQIATIATEAILSNTDESIKD